MKHNSIIIQIWSSTAKHPQLITIRYWSFACTSQVKVYLGSKVLFATDDVGCINNNLVKICFAVSQKTNIIPSFLQIHKEAEREKTQNQLLNELTPMRNRDGGGPQNMRGGPVDRKKPTRNPNQNDDGWTNVQPKTSQRSSTYDRIDSNKITNLAQSSQRRVSCKLTLIIYFICIFLELQWGS